jgi:protein-tyrosine phosphatase
MHDAGMRRVLVLIEDAAVVPLYEEVFGAGRVFHDPIVDFRLPSPEQLGRILGVLAEADAAGEQIVVHCMAGRGRTGFVLAAWLVYARGMAPDDAVRAVRAAGADRDPYEATLGGAIGEQQVVALLGSLRA